MIQSAPAQRAAPPSPPSTPPPPPPQRQVSSTERFLEVTGWSDAMVARAFLSHSQGDVLRAIQDYTAVSARFTVHIILALSVMYVLLATAILRSCCALPSLA